MTPIKSYWSPVCEAECNVVFAEVLVSGYVVLRVYALLFRSIRPPTDTRL